MHRERCKAIFDDARKLPTGQRDAFLDSACGSESELRAEVAQLLSDLDAAGDFLADPTVSLGALPAPRLTGGLVGPYTLLERIGEGGFGEVWLAEQREPRRRVALKIIKAGMDSGEVLTRFAVEQQALALMDHPNVAKVFDAGRTGAQSPIGGGRPYFVMEHAAGLPITEYCDTNRLRIRQRLELFVPICQAVQHAHTKGIIHRDLKPSNILVTLAEGRPAPKVIDFGIAKATTIPLTDRTLYTQAGRLMGTPEYMSPEQAGTSGIDVDTRTDIYSLGVILYQLLTGTLPFDPRVLRKADYSSLVNIIREQEPPRPSTRLSTLSSDAVNQHGGATPRALAQARDVDFATLQRQVRGELDWIVMKCLEKDRARRYETANGLAADVQRYLAGEPVAAAPPSRLYRLRKFARRNRAMMIAGALVATTFVLGLAGTSSGLVWALRAQGLANREAQHARQAERQAEDRLGDAYVAQAREKRLRREPGFTSECLALLGRAVQARGATLDMRNEALASLGQADLLVDRALPRVPDLWEAPSPFHETVLVQRTHAGDLYVDSDVDTVGEEYWISRPREQDELGKVQLDPGAHHLLIVYQERFSRNVRMAAWDMGQRHWLWQMPIADQASALFWDFSPDGQSFARTYPGRDITISNTRDGALVRIVPNSFTINDVLWLRSPSGTWLLLADGDDSRVVFRDLSANTTRELLLPSRAYRLAQSSDGRWLAVGCVNHSIYLYELDPAGSPVIAPSGVTIPRAILSGHTAHPKQLYFTMNDTLLVSRADDYTTRFWDVKGGYERFAPLRNYCVLGADQQRIALPTARGIELRRLASSSLCRSLAMDSGDPVFLSENLLAIGGNAGLALWDLRAGVQVSKLTDKLVSGVEVMDGGVLAAVFADGLIFWPIDVSGPAAHSGEPIMVWKRPGLTDLCTTPDQSLAFVSVGDDHVWRVPLADPDAATLFVEQLGARANCVSADGARLAVGNWRGDEIVVYSVTDGRRIFAASLPGRVHTMATARFAYPAGGGELLIVATTEVVQFFDAPTYSLRLAIPRGGWIPSVAASGDGGIAMITYDGGSPALINLESLQELAKLTLPEPNNTVSRCEFSPSGDTLVMLTNTRPAFVWDLRAMHQRLGWLGLDWPPP